MKVFQKVRGYLDHICQTHSDYVLCKSQRESAKVSLTPLDWLIGNGLLKFKRTAHKIIEDHLFIHVNFFNA